MEMNLCYSSAKESWNLTFQLTINNMTNGMESFNPSVLASGPMMATSTPLSSRHWEKVSDLRVIFDIVVAVGNVQLGLGNA